MFGGAGGSNMVSHTRLIPVHFVGEQLSRWKYLTLFLICQTTITIIKFWGGLYAPFFLCNICDRRPGR